MNNFGSIQVATATLQLEQKIREISAVREPGYLDNIYVDKIYLDFINLDII